MHENRHEREGPPRCWWPPCYRPGKKLDPRIIKAVRFAEGDETLRHVLDDQMDFDEQIVEAIHSIRPPENLRAKLDELTAEADGARPAAKLRWFHPSVLAIVFGVLLIIGFGVWVVVEGDEDFPGKAAAVRETAHRARRDEWHGTRADDAACRASLATCALHERLRGLTRCRRNSRLRARGRSWRVVHVASVIRVAQLAIDQHSAIVFVFRASDFGVRLDEPVARDGQRLTGRGAVKEQDGLCTLVAFRGDKAEMQQFIQIYNNTHETRHQAFAFPAGAGQFGLHFVRPRMGHLGSGQYQARRHGPRPAAAHHGAKPLRWPLVRQMDEQQVPGLHRTGEPESGNLRLVLTKYDPYKYRIDVRANWLIFKTDYETFLDAHQHGNVLHLHGESEGWKVFGGTYRYDGQVTPHRFTMSYESAYDNGTFELKAVGGGERGGAKERAKLILTLGARRRRAGM